MQALIFDMDGTLVDSEKFWMLMPRILLRENGIVLTDGEWENASWRSTSFRGTLKAYFSLPECALKQSYEECEKWCRDYIYNRIYASGDQILLKQGAKEAVEAAASLGLPMCIVSMTPVGMIDFTLSNLGIRRYFTFVYSTDQQPLTKKDPELFDQIAARLGTIPEECLVIEDSLYAMIGAKTAGCSVWAVPDEKHVLVRKEIQDTADRYFENLSSLAEAFSALK